ncbi:MAG: mannonate dehydratase [Candidatus Poribacteria bacterium]|nr:mannonate dehydratase [Candidatus Poribacteria bacterium]
MRVGIQTGLTDVEQIVDYCHQADVDEIVLSASAIPGFTEKGFICSDSIDSFIDEVAQRGIKISGMIPPNPSRDAVLGENKDEVTNLCRILQAIGETNVKTVLFYPFDRFKNYLSEYHHEKPPLEVMPGDEMWKAIIGFFKQIADVAEVYNLNIANHVFAVDIMRQVFDEVKSSNLGVVYCTGMYIFGNDPYAGIDIYGIKKVFLCHARNLIRHGPGRQGHEEVPLDSGDIDMARYIHNLVNAGYEGLVIPEHWGKTGNVVDSVAYLKKLIKGASYENH